MSLLQQNLEQEQHTLEEVKRASEQLAQRSGRQPSPSAARRSQAASATPVANSRSSVRRRRRKPPPNRPRRSVRQKRYTGSVATPGQLLRDARRRHGLTQQQLAVRARTSQAAISRIERGLVSPSVSMLAQLLDLMGEELVLEAHAIDYGHDRTLLRANLGAHAGGADRVHRRVLALRRGAPRQGACRTLSSTRRRSSSARPDEVDFVLIGGLAAAALGSSRSTYDIDVAYGRTTENLERLDERAHRARGDASGSARRCPFLLDAKTLASGLNFTFSTRFGALDILGEPAGAPRYEDLKSAALTTRIRGFSVRVASLDHMIAMKEAAGRPARQADRRRVACDLRRAARRLSGQPKGWPRKSNPVCLGSYVSRAEARREIAGFRPGFWPRGQ